MTEDPDATLALMAELVSATDERLRAQARALATRLVLDRARSAPARRSGAGRLRAVPADRGGDLDIDASIDALLDARAQRRRPSTADLLARDWARPNLAACLLVDASGSMHGARLAAAAITAAACAWRAPQEHAVLAFAREVTTIRAMTGTVSADDVVRRVLALRGHGVTGLAGALQAADEELSRSRAARRVTILLSDCRATDEQDPVPVAGRLSELVILAPGDDHDAAEDLARRSGARWAALHSATEAPALLEDLLR